MNTTHVVMDDYAADAESAPLLGGEPASLPTTRNEQMTQSNYHARSLRRSNTVDPESGLVHETSTSRRSSQSGSLPGQKTNKRKKKTGDGRAEAPDHVRHHGNSGLNALSQWATGGSRGAANAHAQRSSAQMQMQQQQQQATRKEKVGAYNKFVALPSSPTAQSAFTFPTPGQDGHWARDLGRDASAEYGLLGHSPSVTGLHEGLRGRITVCCTAA
eukprot:Opistho-2@65215